MKCCIMSKIRLPRKLKKIVTNNCIRECKLKGQKFKSLRFTKIDMKNRCCEIDFKLKFKKKHLWIEL
jgi:hypothetical protein